MTVELYSTGECKLCDDARKLLESLTKEFHFEVNEVKLTEEHPKYKEYMHVLPVVVINGRRQLASPIREDELRGLLKEEKPPSRLFHFGKFLEAIGFLTLAVGLMYGVMGNMWIDLYFFLAGIVVFYVGRLMERHEMKNEARFDPPEDYLLKPR